MYFNYREEETWRVLQVTSPYKNEMTWRVLHRFDFMSSKINVEEMV